VLSKERKERRRRGTEEKKRKRVARDRVQEVEARLLDGFDRYNP